MARFSKDYNIDGYPITDNGKAMCKSQVIYLLNEMHERIKQLESTNIIDTEKVTFENNNATIFIDNRD